MKALGYIALTAFCAVGFFAWVWKLTNGLPLTFETGFFTLSSFCGAALFATCTAEELKK